MPAPRGLAGGGLSREVNRAWWCVLLMAVAGCLLAALAGCGSRLLAGSDRWVFHDGGEGAATTKVRLESSDALLAASSGTPGSSKCRFNRRAVRQLKYKPRSPSKSTACAVDPTLAGDVRRANPDVHARKPPAAACAGGRGGSRAAALITAGLFPNPQLVLDTEAPTDGGPLDFGGRVMFTIPTGFKRQRAASAAKADIVRAQWAIDAEAHVLLWETADAALEVLYLQKLVALQRELTALTEEAAELSRERVRSGIVGSANALATEINAVEFEFEGLNRLRGVGDCADAALAGAGSCAAGGGARGGELEVQPVEARPLADLLAEAAQVRPELAAANMAIEKSRRDVAAARAEAIPDVELGPLFGTELAKDGDASVGVRLGMDLPWFDRNARGHLRGGVGGPRQCGLARRGAGQLAARPGQRVSPVAADRGCGGAVRGEDHALGTGRRSSCSATRTWRKRSTRWTFRISYANWCRFA